MTLITENSLSINNNALSCRKGGLVTQRHNEVCDAFSDLASLAWNQVVKEPIVRKASQLSHNPALVTDFSARGVWTPQSEALVDIDTDARTYCSRSPMDVLSAAEEEKKRSTNLLVMIGGCFSHHYVSQLMEC